MREVVVLSGKGGTGKTSIVGAFASLAKDKVLSDCDVDAADLHLLLNPVIKQRGLFSGGKSAEIKPDYCTGCGDCFRECRFEAIREVTYQQRDSYEIDSLACEGCGVCCIVCEHDAVRCEQAINGEWYISDTRLGPMSHAKLGVAEENSGRLVTLVRDKNSRVAASYAISECIIDGSPGTGCPVIASITGAAYALAVTEPTVSGLHDLQRVLEVIQHFRIPSGVIVNKADLNANMTEKIREMAKKNNATFLGTLPYDFRITEAQVNGLSVVEYVDDELTEKIRVLWEAITAEVFAVS